MKPHLQPQDLQDKVIDVHSHAGVELKVYARMEYPYAQSVESLYYRQLAGGIDVNVVFPFSGDLYFDPNKLRFGVREPASDPISPTPYAIENRTILREIFDYCPEHAERFVPFVSADPARDVAGQVKDLDSLSNEYPIYGYKINPVGCQSAAIRLLDEGRPLLELAESKNWPILFHAAPGILDSYSQAEHILQIAGEFPGIRFCLAHCLLFHENLLNQAEAMDNVWVDTAAMKIQVDCVRNLVAEGKVSKDDLLDVDLNNYTQVTQAIVSRYPDMILWGSDAPAYTYVCKRLQGNDTYQEFRLKGTYEDEVGALRCLPDELQKKVSNQNTLRFLFG